jgi:hypothetical protein
MIGFSLRLIVEQIDRLIFLCSRLLGKARSRMYWYGFAVTIGLMYCIKRTEVDSTDVASPEKIAFEFWMAALMILFLYVHISPKLNCDLQIRTDDARDNAGVQAHLNSIKARLRMLYLTVISISALFFVARESVLDKLLTVLAGTFLIQIVSRDCIEELSRFLNWNDKRNM